MSITLKDNDRPRLPTPSEEHVIMFRDHDGKIMIKNHLGEVREATVQEVLHAERLVASQSRHRIER